MEENLQGLKLVSTITGIDDRIFYLYDNGNVYEKNSKGDLVMLDKEKDKEILCKIFGRFKNLKTDVIE